MTMSPNLSRRGLFGALACGCATFAVGAGLRPVRAASPVAATTLTADEVLARLKAGNEAFVAGGACSPAGGPAHISTLSGGQAPFAVVVTCSDSRIPPEHVFGAGLGELFVIRVAGNTVDDSALGSIEYGVAVLGAPLVLVMGHTQCGAVQAAIQMAAEGTTFPGRIGDMVQPILPAVLRARRAGGYLVTDAVKANVEDVVARLGTASPLLAQAQQEKGLRLAGGVYDLATGKVAFLG